MQDNLNTGGTVATGVPTAQGGFEAQGLGTLWLMWNDVGLTRLDLPGRGRDGDASVSVCDLPARFADPLRAYFAGEDVDPTDIPVDLRGTAFQVRVWEALRRIPRGKVRSYAGIARDIGSPRAMRAVGMANSANPVAIVVPCHRVVEKGHRLGGYSGGLDRKVFLLELEGVQVEGDRVLPGQLDLPDIP